MKLLLIEDETALRAALVPLLEDAGYRVASAADGLLGMERALGEPFDLILLDIICWIYSVRAARASGSAANSAAAARMCRS